MQIRVLVSDPRLNELLGILVILLAVGTILALASYSPTDASFNVATTTAESQNWMGLPGSYSADLLLQVFGLAAFMLPVALGALGWSKFRRRELRIISQELVGALLLTLVACCALQIIAAYWPAPVPTSWQGTVQPGGSAGSVAVESLTSVLNLGGTALLLIAVSAVGVYLVSSPKSALPRSASGSDSENATIEGVDDGTVDAAEPGTQSGTIPVGLRVDDPGGRIHTAAAMQSTAAGATGTDFTRIEDPPDMAPIVPLAQGNDRAKADHTLVNGKSPEPEPLTSRFKLPDSAILNPPLARTAYDKSQLQETARRIVSKLEEFKVRGSITQINPGPVVTTFEHKPDRGVKVSKIINLSEELCLGLECESVLVERIPGRPTVGIEVPNKNREIVSMREIVDSPMFRDSKSMLTFALGKDINGKIHCADLAGMPHLLVAGQTGSGKSVMVNGVIMSILLRATPKQVRFILVDPKTVELALYRDIPHLLTPVITDMKEATNALKNATLEMQRRLQLLAVYGVRNISQFNAKVEGLRAKGDADEDLEPLPYIVVIVDELADLMMLAGRQVEESIQRLAQMARAVGIHLLLATQRPSVDVITGLIKANIPARLSFLVATRVDSRTILDGMGAESLLGKGDMLFLPPGAPRRRRLHGPLVSEDEIEAVVEHWKEQAAPVYETAYLESPEGEKEESSRDDDAFEDDKYQDAVRLVVESGKASTSILQRRLRLGYGRAARILDAMERDGIIGPPDGSRPRKVLKRPDWLDEVATD